MLGRMEVMGVFFQVVIRIIIIVWNRIEFFDIGH